MEKFTIAGRGIAALATFALLVPTAQAKPPVRIPLVAAQIAAPVTWEPQAAQDHRYRDRGWGGYGWRRHRDRVDGGDLIIAGAILGTIAVIASAHEKDRRERRDDDRWRYRDRPRDVPPPPGARNEPQGERGPRAGDTDLIEDVTDACVHSAQRDGPVDRVEAVNRAGQGWRVEGRMADGRDFTCETDSEGRVVSTDVNGRSRGYSRAEDPRPQVTRGDDNGQDWSDSGRDEQPRGGSGRGSPDDRYQTSRAPDFEDGAPI